MLTIVRQDLVDGTHFADGKPTIIKYGKIKSGNMEIVKPYQVIDTGKLVIINVHGKWRDTQHLTLQQILDDITREAELYFIFC